MLLACGAADHEAGKPEGFALGSAILAERFIDPSSPRSLGSLVASGARPEAKVTRAPLRA